MPKHRSLWKRLSQIVTYHARGQGENRRGQIRELLWSFSGGFISRGFPIDLILILEAFDEHYPWLKSSQQPAPLHVSSHQSWGHPALQSSDPSVFAQSLFLKNQCQDKKGRWYYKYHHIPYLKTWVARRQFKFSNLSAACNDVSFMNDPYLFTCPLVNIKHIMDHEILRLFLTTIMARPYAQDATDRSYPRHLLCLVRNPLR